MPYFPVTSIRTADKWYGDYFIFCATFCMILNHLSSVPAVADEESSLLSSLSSAKQHDNPSPAVAFRLVLHVAIGRMNIREHTERNNKITCWSPLCGIRYCCTSTPFGYYDPIGNESAMSAVQGLLPYYSMFPVYRLTGLQPLKRETPTVRHNGIFSESAPNRHITRAVTPLVPSVDIGGRRPQSDKHLQHSLSHE